MSYLAPWIHTPFAQALGWTLVHFLWEGVVLAVILMAAQKLFRGASARLRYRVACLVLAAMPLAFAATLAVIWANQPAPLHRMPIAGPLDRPLPLASIALAPPSRFTLAAILDRLSWLVPFWLVGVAFFYVRALAGWGAAQRLRRHGVCAPAHQWQERLDVLVARMRLSRPVVLLESCLTDTPVLIGYLRPVILLPLGCLTGLSAAQVECILVHELAHVVRHDYIVNLLQSAVEGLLFYHPAVWWASRVVRSERENCCDDCVVELMGDARSYAATLATLEERRALAPHAALAATGGNLMKRIRRLTVESPGQTSAIPAASAGLLVVVFAAGLAAVPSKLPIARHRRPAGIALAAAAPQPARKSADQDAVAATPYQKWLTEDVVYIITDSERAEFSALGTDAEREEFIQEFWQRRDPTPGTAENEFKAEHYRRIAFANVHFAASVAGWKTDRGRIYITYGPPDEIDDHSSGGSYQRPAEQGGGATTTYPFQNWRYRYLDGIGANIIIEFVDTAGTGDFHMTMDPAEKELLAQAGETRVGAEAKPHAAAAPAQEQRPEVATPYRKWLNQDVAYIITDEERAAFLRLQSDAGRERFIEQFWKVRDPSPNTPQNEFKDEHYRRVAYANEHFSTGVPGWKTDRGRIYVMYGAPDTITTNSPTSISWSYRFIEGMGNNVKIDFVDPNGDGEFRLVGPPALAGSVIAPPEASGAKGAGDVLAVQRAREARGQELVNLDAIIAQKQAAVRSLSNQYQPTYPKVIEAEEQIRELEAERESLEKQMDAGHPAISQSEAVTTQAQAQEERMRAQIAALEEQVLKQEQGLQQAADADKSAKLQMLGSEQAQLNLLREKLQHLNSQLEAARAEAARAAGKSGSDVTLTAAQLQSALGPDPSVRVIQTAHADQKTATIIVPLVPPGDSFHVFGQITVHNKVVASFDDSVSGQPALARVLPLRAGTYHLVVIVRNTNGRESKSSTDFTIN